VDDCVGGDPLAGDASEFVEWLDKSLILLIYISAIIVNIAATTAIAITTIIIIRFSPMYTYIYIYIKNLVFICM
jgi:hypothetical protein